MTTTASATCSAAKRRLRPPLPPRQPRPQGPSLARRRWTWTTSLAAAPPRLLGQARTRRPTRHPARAAAAAAHRCGLPSAQPQAALAPGRGSGRPQASPSRLWGSRVRLAPRQSGGGRGRRPVSAPSRRPAEAALGSPVLGAPPPPLPIPRPRSSSSSSRSKRRRPTTTCWETCSARPRPLPHRLRPSPSPSPPAPPALRPICLGPLRLLLRQLRPTQPLLLCSTATPSTTLTLAAPGAGRAAVLQRRQRRPRLRRHPTPSTCSIDRSAESNPARRALVGRLCSCAWVWVWTCVCQGQWAPRERRVAPRAMQDGRRFHFTRSKLTKPAKP
mmetsp:Transcript_3309/g.13630  ORF Transcript_3309/g.13630 Transcript_3309/m.13630 type:complete len:330 (-) Transcript_3309:2940-3929(-)